MHLLVDPAPSNTSDNAEPDDDAFLNAVAAGLAALADAHDPLQRVEACLDALHRSDARTLVSVHAYDSGRLWLVAQRGYLVLPDGVDATSGVLGRAVATAQPQYVPDVLEDSAYIPVAGRIAASLGVPLLAEGQVVGVLSIERRGPLMPESVEGCAPLAVAVAASLTELRLQRPLDTQTLGPLLVHLTASRAPEDIAAAATRLLRRVFPVETSQVFLFTDEGVTVPLADWRATAGPDSLLPAEIDALRDIAEPFEAFQLLELEASGTDGEDHGRTVAWAPLRVGRRELGVLVATTRWSREVADEPAATAALLAAQTAAAIDKAFALSRAERIAATDSLTGLTNRRGLDEIADLALAEARAAKRPVSVLILDCDDFKHVNDRAGHAFGDALLRETASVLAAVIPADATAARLGGDEFAVILPGTGGEPARGVADAIRLELAAGLADEGFPLDVSIGVSTFPFDGGSVSQLMRAADQALYQAKRTGKNRVATFSDVQRDVPIDPGDRRRHDRAGATAADVCQAATAIERACEVGTALDRLCKSLIFIVGATACAVSRVDGTRLVEVARHTLRDVDLSTSSTRALQDFPLIRTVISSGTPKAVSLLDPNADPATVHVLREAAMSSVLLVPTRVTGEAWGLVELYDARHRCFVNDDLFVATFLAAQAARRIAALPAATTPEQELPVRRLPASVLLSANPPSSSASQAGST